MPTGLREGLGGEGLLPSGIGALTQNVFLLGSLQVSDQIIAGLSVVATGSGVFGGIVLASGTGVTLTTGSPYYCGLVVPFTARTIISGGQFVSMSGGLAYAAPASTKVPIGIAVATAQSGAVASVLINGIAPVIVESTVAVGAPAMMGAGAGLNCVVAATAASGVRLFSPLDAGASGATATIFVQF